MHSYIGLQMTASIKCFKLIAVPMAIVGILVGVKGLKGYGELWEMLFSSQQLMIRFSFLV